MLCRISDNPFHFNSYTEKWSELQDYFANLL